MGSLSPSVINKDGAQPTPQSPTATAGTTNTIVDEAQECLAQSLLMFIYADLRLLSATGRINTKFETLCIDSDRVPRTTSAEMAQDHSSASNSRSTIDYCDCEGVSPGQIMAILIVELRQEVLAQRRKVKEDMKKDRELKKERGWLPNLNADEDDEEESDDDDDAGVMNKITDRKGRKEFETDMHALIRSYNSMLARDLKGIPEVKLERMLPKIPLRMPSTLIPRRASNANLAGKTNKQPRPWLRPGGLTQRLFSFDDVDQTSPADQSRHESDDEGSKNSKNSATGRMKISAMFTGSLWKSQRGEPIDQIFEAGAEEPLEEGVNEVNKITDSFTKMSTIGDGPRLSFIEESKSEDERETERATQVSESKNDLEGEQDAQKSTNEKAGGKLTQSKIFEIVRGMRASRPPDDDVHSFQSDPGPDQSRYGDNPDGNTRPPMHRRPNTLKKQLTQHLTDYVERYREDHALYGNKLIIPTDDYETFAGAEDVGNRIAQMKLSSNLNMSCLPELSESDTTGRNMSEKELLDFMTKCVESRDVESLDFMSDFFRDDTVSQTMVKSKAQVVWIQDWYPIKDCIYAISVDKKKKRVLVVFRGATTRADWSHGFDAAVKRGHNPVTDEYEGKKNYLQIHRGFYTYLFRIRKDTGTRKYDEIANKVFEYGNKMIGSDFTVTVNGYSLGGALSVLFGFYASSDDRFTQNGPVKIFSYGMPYAVSHTFADAFRHQERKRKVQHARFYNSNDLVAHMPFNMKTTSRGSNFVHVGIDVKLYPVPGVVSPYGSRYPRLRYNDRQSAMCAYWRAIKMNSFLNMPFPWQIRHKHGLPELQKRIARAILVAETAKTTKIPFLRSTLDEAYEAMVYKKED
mmetsp:Transcript_32179/g.67634  ORF Transcript_32179/g.67634 Transcript_32179/m.67634 type:complete len:860 (+) Transcript_32179:190-2769(+)